MLKKRSITIRGHRTSVTLEPEFWDAVEALAARRGQTLSAFITRADIDREEHENLSSALRLIVLRDLTARRLSP
ncbi:MAG: ribbon-helix-helix domain-containing protein [Pseudomonadota bacterium]